MLLVLSSAQARAVPGPRMSPGAIALSLCVLRVQDALDEIARQRPKDLFKPLRVHFIGEEGIDAGGVKKEFFQLLVAELLCPDYGMLIQNPVCALRPLHSAARSSPTVLRKRKPLCLWPVTARICCRPSPLKQY